LRRSFLSTTNRPPPSWQSNGNGNLTNDKNLGSNGHDDEEDEAQEQDHDDTDDQRAAVWALRSTVKILGKRRSPSFFKIIFVDFPASLNRLIKADRLDICMSLPGRIIDDAQYEAIFTDFVFVDSETYREQIW